MRGLFKYFPVDLYKVENLACHQIQLTPPKYFNDPWDFLVQREPATEDEIRTMSDTFERDLGGNVDFDEFKAGITTPDFREGEGPKMQEGLSRIFGVVSLTGDPCNRLMWAYYADSHRGFVAEFAHRPATETQGMKAVVSPFGIAIKALYPPGPPKVLKTDFSNALEVYSIKHQEWRHENEWRVFEFLKRAVPEQKNGKTFYLLGFKPEYLLRVILGLRIDPEIEKRLSEMLTVKEFRHVKMEKMTIDVSSGELVCR